MSIYNSSCNIKNDFVSAKFKFLCLEMNCKCEVLGRRLLYCRFKTEVYKEMVKYELGFVDPSPRLTLNS